MSDARSQDMIGHGGPRFSGVVLAGGRSTRMGRDKALLALPTGETLLARAVATLRVAGASEVLVSVRTGQSYAMPDTREIVDEVAGCGPLAGLAAALAAAKEARVAVFAVDLPRMTADYLRRLLARTTETRGTVPVRGEFVEPLAAIYPRVIAADLARGAITAGTLSLQAWVRALAARRAVQLVAVPAADVACFANWNSPDDLRCDLPAEIGMRE